MLKHQRYVLSRIGFLFQGSQGEFESRDCHTLREGNSLLKEQGNQYLGEQVSLIPHCVMCVSCSVVTNSWQPRGLQPTRLLCPWDFPGKSTGVGFPRQEYWSGISQARVLEWVAIPFSRRSSAPRDQTQVYRILGIFCLPSESPGSPNSTLGEAN